MTRTRIASRWVVIAAAAAISISGCSATKTNTGGMADPEAPAVAQQVNAVTVPIGSAQKVESAATSGTAVLTVTDISRRILLRQPSGEQVWSKVYPGLEKEQTWVVTSVNAAGATGQYPLDATEWTLVGGGYTYQADTTTQMPKKLDTFQLAQGQTASFTVVFNAPEGAYKLHYQPAQSEFALDWDVQV